MKKSCLYVVPALLVVAGCNAPAANNTAANNDSDAAASTPVATASPGAPEKVTSDKGAPDPKYRVAAETNSQMPAELVAALEKAQVPPPPLVPPAPKRARVVMHTSKGDITVELNGEAAPLHVKSFLYLVKRGFYNGTVFHRFADLLEGSGQPGKGRIIQGGDPLTKTPTLKEYFGAGGPGYQVPREHNALKHGKMVIAAARSQDPDSAGSQFYFTLDPVPFLDEGDGYTVFGKVLSGQDVVLKLRADDKLNKVTAAGEASKAPTVAPAHADEHAGHQH
jgi:cyclophilin family peptidyl-prolyl cis-trans isomerase